MKFDASYLKTAADQLEDAAKLLRRCVCYQTSSKFPIAQDLNEADTLVKAAGFRIVVAKSQI